MRCHSCAHLDLLTKLSPERGDEGQDLHNPSLFFCEGGGGMEFAAGSWMATSKEFPWPDSTVTYCGFSIGCG